MRLAIASLTVLMSLVPGLVSAEPLTRSFDLPFADPLTETEGAKPGYAGLASNITLLDNHPTVFEMISGWSDLSRIDAVSRIDMPDEAGSQGTDTPTNTTRSGAQLLIFLVVVLGLVRAFLTSDSFRAFCDDTYGPLSGY